MYIKNRGTEHSELQRAISFKHLPVIPFQNKSDFQIQTSPKHRQNLAGNSM